MFDRDSNSFIMQNHFDQAELIIQGESGNLWSRATQLRACTTPSVHHLDQDQFQMFQNTPSFPGKLPQAEVSTIFMVGHLSLKQRHSGDSCLVLRSTMSWPGQEANRDAPSGFKLSCSMQLMSDPHYSFLAGAIFSFEVQFALTMVTQQYACRLVPRCRSYIRETPHPHPSYVIF